MNKNLSFVTMSPGDSDNMSDSEHVSIFGALALAKSVSCGVALEICARRREQNSRGTHVAAHALRRRR